MSVLAIQTLTQHFWMYVHLAICDYMTSCGVTIREHTGAQPQALALEDRKKNREDHQSIQVYTLSSVLQGSDYLLTMDEIRDVAEGMIQKIAPSVFPAGLTTEITIVCRRPAADYM